MSVSAVWTYPHGGRATSRCVNAGRLSSEHNLSDDRTHCLACGAVRTVLRPCVICHKEPAEVPDREAMGRPINKVCLGCHKKRLQKDWIALSEWSARTE